LHISDAILLDLRLFVAEGELVWRMTFHGVYEVLVMAQ
jgi:hypothetical protein